MGIRIKSCTDMPGIRSCEASECSYNRDNQCHTVAITIGDISTACCDTYLKLGRKGGVMDLTGGVGACKVESCRFNSELECSADSGIQVSHQNGLAECITFRQA
jgi:hypothetical protein